MRLLLLDLRRWDLASSFRMDHFVANSRTVPKCIRFLNRQNGVAVADLLVHSRALLFPGEEDRHRSSGSGGFGCSCVAYVLGGRHGNSTRRHYRHLFRETTCRGKEAPPFLSSNAGNKFFDPQALRLHAENFGEECFRQEFACQVELARTAQSKALYRKFSRPHSRKAPQARFCPESTDPSRPTSC